MTYPPSHPFVFCSVVCLLIPRIFSGACVLCSAGNMRRDSNDSASWCSYCHGVTMAWVESQFIWLILCRCDSVLSVAGVMCAHICANGAWRNRLLEAVVYQLSCSVIVIANGLSRVLVSINGLGWNMRIHDVLQTTSYFQSLSNSKMHRGTDEWGSLPKHIGKGIQLAPKHLQRTVF